MWHAEVISETAGGTLRELVDRSLLADFYLAGGTGLALHRGHRLSRDFDFFSEKLFEDEPLLRELQQLSGFSLISRAPHTLHTVLGETKVSFLGYAYPILFAFHEFSGARIADPREIACMKVSATTSRGTKRDFVDLYVVAKEFGLQQILGWFRSKYAQTRTAQYTF